MAHKHKPGTEDIGLGGIFRGLGSFVDLISKFADLAEQHGGEFTRSGEVGEEKKGVKAVYGFTVRTGGGGKPVVEQFGNVKDDGGSPVVEETREPMVDIFDEDDHLLVVAELPGVSGDDIHFEVKDDILILMANHGERKYRKEVLLGSVVRIEGVTPSYRNGVFELRLPKTK